MPLVKSKYRENKLKEAKELYPPGTKWTAAQLELDLGIGYSTMTRWLAQWDAQGLLRKIPTEDKLWMRGAVRYWYTFRKTPFKVMTYEEFQEKIKPMAGFVEQRFSRVD